MIHLSLPLVLVAALAGAGAYGVVARRNAVLVLIGVELILNAANLLLVTSSAALPEPLRGGQVLTLFVITIAAAEVGLALAVVLALYRSRGHIDLTQPVAGAADDAADDADADAAEPELEGSADADDRLAQPRGRHS